MKTMMGWLCLVIILTNPAMAFSEVNFCGQVIPDYAITVRCSDSSVSDVSSLVTLTKLESLSLTKTKASPEQIEALQKALPKLKVYGP